MCPRIFVCWSIELRRPAAAAAWIKEAVQNAKWVYAEQKPISCVSNLCYLSSIAYACTLVLSRASCFMLHTSAWSWDVWAWCTMSWYHTRSCLVDCQVGLSQLEALSAGSFDTGSQAKKDAACQSNSDSDTDDETGQKQFPYDPTSC